MYAKWGQASITGIGNFNVAFLVGSLNLSGQGTITLLGIGGGTGFTPSTAVYLVE